MSEPNADDWGASNRIELDAHPTNDAFVVDLDGYEGPLDLLLSLSRNQKLDIRKISVLQLAEQYLRFVDQAVSLRIELAADYLVMAAWMAFLKSRLLLPPEPGQEGPSADEMAAHLAYQLERLSAMRDAAARLMARDRLGRDFFARGEIEVIAQRREVRYEASLIDLLRAYARIRTKDEFRPYAFDRKDIFTMEQALERMRGLLGYLGEWSDLTTFLPQGWDASPARRRSSTAAHFAAILEMAKRGQVLIRQTQTFSPIQLRARGSE